MTPLAQAVEEYLGWLRSHGYAKTTVAGRAHHLHDLVEFLAALDITEPAWVSFAALESYQRHLFRHKKANGGRARKARQLPPLPPHRRHADFEGGADIRYVSEMLGQAKLETTALYTAHLHRQAPRRARRHPPRRQRHDRRRGHSHPARRLTPGRVAAVRRVRPQVPFRA